MSKKVWKTLGIISAVAGVAAGAGAIAKHKLDQKNAAEDADDFVEVSDGLNSENPESQQTSTDSDDNDSSEDNN